MRWRVGLALAAVLVAGAALAAAPRTAYAPRNATPAAAYVGDAECAACHRKQAASYPSTAMGRAFSEPDLARLGLPPDGVSFLHEKSRCRYRVFARDGRLMHSETRLDERGQDLFTDTRRISWVLGSGDRGQTFLIEQGGRLYQSPLALRRHRDGWGMAAGFDEPEHMHFTRPVTGPCLFCHSNRARYVEGSLNEYEPPIFEGLAIGCERCHGPGSLHTRERRLFPPSPDGVDESIVNPARLPGPLRDSVCYQCHLQGDARVVRRGRGVFDFRPGLPLADYFAVFHAERAGHDRDARPEGDPDGVEGIEVVSHVERLRQSRCFRQSGGALTCLTCHDPHRTPRGPEAAAQFRDACLKCHRVEQCRLDEMTRGDGGDPLDCVRCHLARVPPTDAPHTLFTDHRITRRPAPAPPPAPPAPGRRLVSFFEPSGGSGRDLAVATMLYSSRAADPVAAERGAAMLRALAAGGDTDVNGLKLLVEREIEQGRGADAIPLLERLVASAPHVAEFRVELARAQQRAGRTAAALALARAAVGEDPFYAPARLLLGDLLFREGRLQEAGTQHQEAVSLDPALAAAHDRLADAALREKDLQTAEREYRAALALDPALSSARLGLAQVRLSAGRTDEAIEQMRQALQRASGTRARASIGFQLARVLATAGRRAEAIDELRRVLAESPDHAEARGLLESLLHAQHR